MDPVQLTWAQLKSLQVTKLLSWQYVELADRYIVFVIDGSIRYETVLFKPNAALAGGMPAGMDADRIDFETNIKPIANADPTKGPITTSGRPQIGIYPTEGDFVNIITHDWCDPTTWYGQSVYVVDEVAQNSGDNLTYTLAHQNIIDTFHGKLNMEDYLSDANGNSYRVTVTVNGVQKTEVDPHDGVGDFTVDYKAGKVTFNSALSSSDVVKVTYHYENGSMFTVKPKSGKVLYLKKVKVLFTENIEITDTIRFTPYGPVDNFAPQLVNNPYPSGTMIPLSNGTVYKTMVNYLAEVSRNFDKVQDLGGGVGNWRASPVKTTLLEWDYPALQAIKSSLGMEIRMLLDHDTPYTGGLSGKPAHGIACFECFVEDE
jgi:hypothetical protein